MSSSNISQAPSERLERLSAESEALSRDIRKLERKTARKTAQPGGRSCADATGMTGPRNTGGDSRLGSYLVSGSFQPTAHRPVSRPVRRNRIIFITVIVLIVLFSLVWIALGG
jgi:hypothetical protein